MAGVMLVPIRLPRRLVSVFLRYAAQYKSSAPMANFIIDVPDDLAHRLEGIAAAQHKSLQ